MTLSGRTPVPLQIALIALMCVAQGCGEDQESADQSPALRKAIREDAALVAREKKQAHRNERRLRRYFETAVRPAGARGALEASSIVRIEIHVDGGAYIETSIYPDAEAGDLGPAICGLVASSGIVHGHIQVAGSDGSLIGSCEGLPE